MNSQNNISPIFWLWAPALFLIAHLFIQFALPENVVTTLTQEDGPYEYAQFAIIAGAFIVALATLPKRARRPWLAAYVALATVCCFYVAGEEISWGQRFFGWATPADWMAANDHHETNLHNTYAWADKGPRVLLELAICLGAFPVALLVKYRPSLLPRTFEIIYPPFILAVTIACLLFLKIVKPLGEQLFDIDFQRLSEVHELYTYYFVLLYMVILRKRV